MKKQIITFASLVTLVVTVNDVEAVTKIDVGNSTKSFITSVSNFLDNSKKTMDNVSNVDVSKTIGTYEENAQQMQKIINTENENKADKEENPLEKEIDITSPEDDKKAKEESTDENKENKDFKSNLSEKIEKVQKMTDLEQQQQELLDQINTKREASNKEYQGKIAALQKNNQEIQNEIKEHPEKKEELTKQLEKNNTKIKEYQTLMLATEKEITSEDVAKLTDVNAALTSMKAAADKQAQEWTQKVTDKLLSDVKSFNPEEELKQNTEKNFVADGSPVDQENITLRRANRTNTAANTAVDSFVQAAVIKRDLNDAKILTQKLANRTDTTDGSIGANATDTQATIMIIKELAKLIKLKTMDMKLKTSAELAKFEKIDSAVDTDIATFTLDKYICSETTDGGSNE